MNMSIVGVIPWQDAMHSDFIVSEFMEKIYGHRAAVIATVLVLWVAFASLFAVVLGYSRVPYAAAVDGRFFPIFARLHPEKGFPYISLLFIGAMGFLFSIRLRLDQAISAILAMRILVQFVAQAIGVIMLRRREGSSKLPFKMWLYPLPVIVSVAIWLFVWYSTGRFAIYGVALAGIGVAVYYGTLGRWKNDE
jgi:amino acid transporter